MIAFLRLVVRLRSVGRALWVREYDRESRRLGRARDA